MRRKSGWRGQAIFAVAALLTVSFSCFYEAVGQDRLGQFSAGKLDGWEAKTFAGQTSYQIVTIKDQKVLEAVSDGSASGLVREGTINLNQTPILVWRWRVDQVIDSRTTERSKEGDDFSVRIYFVVPGRGLFAFPDSVAYVWSRNQPVGTVWNNPYTDKVRMIAVDSGTEHAGEWRIHRRNMQEDFRNLFGRDAREVSHVAIMTDTDNTGTSARGWYGDIWVEPAP